MHAVLVEDFISFGCGRSVCKFADYLCFDCLCNLLVDCSLIGCCSDDYIDRQCKDFFVGEFLKFVVADDGLGLCFVLGDLRDVETFRIVDTAFRIGDGYDFGAEHFLSECCGVCSGVSESEDCEFCALEVEFKLFCGFTECEHSASCR